MFVFLLLIGLVLLVAGAEMLVRGGGQLALVLRVPVLVVGLTVVAFGTSMPELAVSVTAALNASTDMALANVTGSNIANIALVLGLAALVRPLAVDRALMRREVPACLGLQILVPILLLDDGRLDWLDGLLLVAVGVLYNLTLLYDAFRGRMEVSDEDKIELEHHWLRSALMFFVGVATLLIGSRLFVYGAIEVAGYFELSERYVGLTVVALGTSAPEVMTAVVSAHRGQAGMAIGNSIGSNILNVAMVLGATAIIQPIEVSDQGAWKDLVVAVLLTSMLVPVIRRGKGISRVEGGLLAGSYVLYLIMLPTI